MGFPPKLPLGQRACNRLTSAAISSSADQCAADWRCQLKGKSNQPSSGSILPEGTAALRPVLGYRDLVLFYVVAIFGIRLLPAAAAAGPSVVILILIALAAFFIPLALTVTDLSQRYPEEGGVYVWAKTAFGDFHGYFAAWMYWTSNLAFFPSLLLFSSSQIGFILPGGEHLAENQSFLSVFSIGTILAILLLNIIGLKHATLLNNISALARFLSVALILGIGLGSWLMFGSATDLSVGNWIPRLGSVRDLIFLSTIVYLFAGLEGASTMGDEIQDARKVIPRAIFTSSGIISALYILSALALLLAVSPEQLSALQGFSAAVSAGAGKIGGDSFAIASTFLISLLLFVVGVGGLSVWLATAARLPFVVGLDNYLPPIFGRLHPKYRTPHVALIALVAVTIFFIILSGMGEKAAQVYSILISLEVVTFLIPYLYLFGAVIKFEMDRKYRRRINIPGGRKNALAAGITGFIVVACSLFLGLIPGEDVENPMTFYLTVFSSLFLNLSVGIGIYWYAKRKRLN